MLVIFRKFAVTRANVKVLAALLVLFFAFFILAAQGKAAKIDSKSKESVGGRENIVTVELAALETTGVSEPEDLTQSQHKMLHFSSYTVQQGDVLGEIAKKFGLSISTVASVNDISNTRTINVGKMLRVPNQDGVFYKVRTGDTLSGITEKHKAELTEIKAANELFSEKINPNTILFIPGATAPWQDIPVVVVQAAPRAAAQPVVVVSNNIFDWPLRGHITSNYGYRWSPFSRGRSFHDGLDIAAVTGTPIRAAMAGRVESVGYDNVYGNFVIIRHADGYKTLYGHLDSYEARSGAYVDVDSVIGYVGNTGQSTGAHLHFTVYKDGSSINPRAALKP
jgi:murein DD-endopeptidase MepM/ murein hydrolase activator NlpD